AAAVMFSGAQFATDGYLIKGAPLTTDTQATIVRVGFGSGTPTSFTATISAVIQGLGGIVKEDPGMLILSGANTYEGGTTIDEGTVQVGANNNLGDAGGGLTFNGGTLATTASFISGRTVTINGPAAPLAGGGTFDVANATTLELTGAVGGAGTLIKNGAGT